MCSCHSILECCVMFSGVKLGIRAFVLLLLANLANLVFTNFANLANLANLILTIFANLVSLANLANFC